MRHIESAFLSALILTLLAGAASAHEHWVDVASFYPAVGETVDVYVRSGHHFPQSEQVLEDKVVEGLRVWDGGESPRTIATVAHDKFRAGKLIVEHEGVHVLDLTLKRPRAKEPSFEAKTIVVVNRLKDDPARYGLGEGLELTPGEPVSSVAAGDTLSVRLTLDGEPLAGSLQVVPEKGRTRFIRTEPGKPALIPLRTAGRYLVTAQVGGRGASLVFDVLEKGLPAEREEITQ
jgi:hypothetical protein